MQSSPFHFVTDINSSDTKKQDETHQGILTSAKLFDFFIIIIIAVTRVFKFLIKYSMKISSRQYHVPQLNNLNLKNSSSLCSMHNLEFCSSSYTLNLLL